MQLFIDEIAGRYPNENIVMIMDGAGWHRSHSLRLPGNLQPLLLPPYSPELNPQEHVWDELREKHFHNKAFECLPALEEQLVTGLKHLEQRPALMQSIAWWEWILNSVSNANWNYTHVAGIAGGVKSPLDAIDMSAKTPDKAMLRALAEMPF